MEIEGSDGARDWSQLVVSDGNAGLEAAPGRIRPEAAHQRCAVHKLRNLLAKTRKHVHDAVRQDYSGFAASHTSHSS